MNKHGVMCLCHARFADLRKWMLQETFLPFERVRHYLVHFFIQSLQTLSTYTANQTKGVLMWSRFYNWAQRSPRLLLPFCQSQIRRNEIPILAGPQGRWFNRIFAFLHCDHMHLMQGPWREKWYHSSLLLWSQSWFRSPSCGVKGFALILGSTERDFLSCSWKFSVCHSLSRERWDLHKQGTTPPDHERSAEQSFPLALSSRRQLLFALSRTRWHLAVMGPWSPRVAFMSPHHHRTPSCCDLFKLVCTSLFPLCVSHIYFVHMETAAGLHPACGTRRFPYLLMKIQHMKLIKRPETFCSNDVLFTGATATTVNALYIYLKSY